VGTPVTHFSLATDELWKDLRGEKQQRTEWHNIVAWSKLAEICGDYLRKGRLVYIEGRLQTRNWEEKDGTKRSTSEISAEEMVMFGTGRVEDARQPTEGSVTEGQITGDDLPKLGRLTRTNRISGQQIDGPVAKPVTFFPRSNTGHR
jgi:single-strand DNA-binding protein